MGYVSSSASTRMSPRLTLFTAPYSSSSPAAKDSASRTLGPHQLQKGRLRPTCRSQNSDWDSCTPMLSAESMGSPESRSWDS